MTWQEQNTVTLAHLAALAGEPDYRAELAELRAQIRYLADELAEEVGGPCSVAAERLRALVGPWPHEVRP